MFVPPSSSARRASLRRRTEPVAQPTDPSHDTDLRSAYEIEDRRSAEKAENPNGGVIAAIELLPLVLDAKRAVRVASHALSTAAFVHLFIGIGTRARLIVE
jgi:hypothetical protein